MNEAKRTETEIQKDIVQVLESVGILIMRNNTGRVKAVGGGWMNLGIPGGSDLIGMLKNGRFLAIEVKALGKYPTADQKAFLKRVNDGGGLGFVARTIEDVTFRIFREMNEVRKK